MIISACEFIFLCASRKASDVTKSLREEAPVEVWRDLVVNFQSHQIDVAQNETLPPEIISLLVDRGDETVRSILAEKRRLPIDFFDSLSRDESPLVRKKIAANRKTPIDIVKNLANDNDEDVARVAKFHLSI